MCLQKCPTEILSFILTFLLRFSVGKAVASSKQNSTEMRFFTSYISNTKFFCFELFLEYGKDQKGFMCFVILSIVPPHYHFFRPASCFRNTRCITENQIKAYFARLASIMVLDTLQCVSSFPRKVWHRRMLAYQLYPLPITYINMQKKISIISG